VCRVCVCSDGQVRDTCHHFGRERRERNSALVYELPAELNILPLLLFHVRRGPLLGPILQHPDDIDVGRFIFLHANRTDALRACIPTLLSFNTKGELEEVRSTHDTHRDATRRDATTHARWKGTCNVTHMAADRPRANVPHGVCACVVVVFVVCELPLETLALQSNRILLLDHHTQILIWSGSQVSTHAYDAYRHACVDRATAHSRHRLPRPEILTFNEGSSASRWMQVRLIPSHKDTEEWQNLTFPQLRTLTSPERQELIDKFLPTDEISFVQFYHTLFTHKST
jgi:hypothetical protein